jgi:hypothetical protein
VSTRPDFSGFAPPYEFTYPQLLLQVVSVVGLVVGGVAAVGLAAGLRGGEVTITFGAPVTGLGVWGGLALGLLGLLVAFAGTLVVHEAIHGLVARALGYHVTFGVARLGTLLYAAYAGTFDQRVSRRDLALVAVAPLVVITLGCILALAVAPDWLVVPLVVALTVNTSGVAGDLYLLYYVGRVPRGSLFYDLSIDEMLVYEPAR